MKRRIIAVGSLAFYMLFSNAQEKQESKFKVRETQVELLYSHYAQNGDNSAVTGGEGTEELTVYGPSFNLKKTFGKNEIGFQLGADIISSASTDNIDKIVSSASRLDARTYSNLNYSRYIEKSKLSISVGLSSSIESDYFSIGKFIGVTKTSKNDMRTYSSELQIFNDDLRWGRLDEGFLAPPQFLIYPSELRFKEWHDDFKRNSYNLNLGFTQVVDQRNTLGIFGALSYHEGLLSTPFHRVFFSDGTAAVEKFPRERYKSAISVRWNKFTHNGIILRNKIGFYNDNFGVLGLTLDSETAIKINAKWTLLPSFRIYMQQESKYFAPMGDHNPNDIYYTSDYDLSSFNSYTFGFGSRHWPLPQKKKKRLQLFELRYFFYSRSDGLKAHTLSTSLRYKNKKVLKQKT